MRTHIFPALKLTGFSLLLFAIAYPLFLLGIAPLAPARGKVELLESRGRMVGAKRIGQKFDAPQYFWSRPSAVDYNAAGSAGSNKGPTNPDYLAAVGKRTAEFLAAHPYLVPSDVPAEMVTASGSGLDPDISPKAARVQVKRVAAARKLPELQVAALVEQHICHPLGGWFGVPKVNVLGLNLALDQLQ